jgi:hypothetical protein
MTTDLPHIATKVGVGVGPDNFFFGCSVAKQLSTGETMGGLIALSVMGRRLPPEESAVLDDLAVAIVSADPRVWPLKLTRLTAALGRTFPAFASGMLALDSEFMGPASAGLAASHLVELGALLELRSGAADAVDSAIPLFLERHSRMAGFGVPFRPYDERLEVLRHMMTRRQRASLRYWVLGLRVAEWFETHRGLKPNLSLGVAAAMLDLGMVPDEISAGSLLLQAPVVMAHALEGARQRSAVLRRLPRRCVRYVGAPPRRSPRAPAI